MKTHRLIEHYFQARLHNLRLRLSHPEALLLLAALGLVSGVVSGTVIVAFRQIIESAQISILADGIVENYERLPVWARFVFPVIGSALIAVCFKVIARGENIVGVVHVMERFGYHQGRLSFRGLILQFIGASISIVSGHSAGREGPSIHIGAASSSLLGQFLSLPNNSLRTLVGCGVAAGIAASFNTPLAGVVFALEVVMMEYSLSSFIPVILAAVSATAVSRFYWGAEPSFSVPPTELVSLLELSYVLIVGMVIGLMATALIQLTSRIAKASTPRPFWLRLLGAGVFTGVCAMGFPQIMGIGYDTITDALLGNLGVGLLLMIVVTKILTTSVTIGLGVPGGIIGPTLFIGATVGAMFGILVQSLFPEVSSDSGLYALLGMGAMMGATLQAPLAALIAVFELSYNPNIILPGMLAIVSASLVTREIFNQQSVFTTLLRARGLDYRNDPVVQAMRRIGVASVMDRAVIGSICQIDRNTAEAILEDRPNWILITEDSAPTELLPAVDLARELEDSEAISFDLMQIPAQRLQVGSVPIQASVDEALVALNEQHVEALVVQQVAAPGIMRVVGVLTKATLESSYRV